MQGCRLCCFHIDNILIHGMSSCGDGAHPLVNICSVSQWMRPNQGATKPFVTPSMRPSGPPALQPTQPQQPRSCITAATSQPPALVWRSGPHTLPVQRPQLQNKSQPTVCYAVMCSTTGLRQAKVVLILVIEQLGLQIQHHPLLTASCRCWFLPSRQVIL